MTAIAFLAFNAVLMAAAASDVRSMRIPNVLPTLLAAGAVVFAFPASWGEAASRLAVAALIALIGGVLWSRRILGGGDLKLLAAAGLWIPLHSAMAFATFLGLAGGAQSLVTLAWVGLQPSLQPRLAPGWRYMPYGVSIAMAGLAWSAAQLP